MRDPSYLADRSLSHEDSLRRSGAGMARRTKPGIADARWIAPAGTRGRAADGAGFAVSESRLGEWDYSSSSATNRLARLGRSRNARSDRPEAIRACSSQRAACVDGGLAG